MAKQVDPPLVDAARRGDLQLVNQLLPTCDVDSKDSILGVTALMWACRGEHKDVVELLLQHGAKLEEKDTNGTTGLHYACVGGYVDIVELLLKHGAKLEAKTTDGATALMWACRHGHMDVVELLLKHGAKLEEKDTNGMTGLHYACDFGYVNIVELLLKHGAKLEAKTTDGMTGLHFACISRYVDIVELLLKHGAKLEAKTTDGMTGLNDACGHGHVDIVKLLLQHGAKLETKSTKGFTPLIVAASYGRTEVVQLLLHNGANARATTTRGATSLSTAAENGHLDVMKVLQEHLGVEAPTEPQPSGTCTDVVRPKLEEQRENQDVQHRDSHHENRMSYDLPNLCDDCRLEVANKTLRLQKVTDVLGKAGTGYCFHLDYEIISKDTAQEIRGAKNDSEALETIRRALPNSLVPDKLDHVIRALSKEEIGMKKHSEKIKECYHEQIHQHTQCEKCMTPTT